MSAKFALRILPTVILLVVALLVAPWSAFGNTLCDTPVNSTAFVGETFTLENVVFTFGAYDSSCMNNTAGLVPASALTITPVSGPHFVGFALSLNTGGDFQASPDDPTLEANQIDDLHFSVDPVSGTRLFAESASITGAFTEGFVTSNSVNWQYFPAGPTNGTKAQAWEATRPDGSPFVINPAYASLDGYGNASSNVIFSFAQVYLQTCVSTRTDCNAGGQTDLVFYQSATYGFYTAPIPEPASLLLLGSGLIGIAGAFRRRRAGA